MRLNPILVLPLLFCSALLQGCPAAVIGGAAAGATVATDSRTTGTLIEDQAIELKARNALLQNREINDQVHLNLTSFNNVLLITGEATTEAIRARAVKLLEGTEKVRKLQNEIAVSTFSTLASRSNDTLITGKVKTQLLSAQGIDAARVKVVTERGIVYLMGLVTQAQGDAITDIARRVGGVQRVVKLFEYPG